MRHWTCFTSTMNNHCFFSFFSLKFQRSLSKLMFFSFKIFMHEYVWISTWTHSKKVSNEQIYQKKLTNLHMIFFSSQMKYFLLHKTFLQQFIQKRTASGYVFIDSLSIIFNCSQHVIFSLSFRINELARFSDGSAIAQVLRWNFMTMIEWLFVEIPRWTILVYWLPVLVKRKHWIPINHRFCHWL